MPSDRSIPIIAVIRTVLTVVRRRASRDHAHVDHALPLSAARPVLGRGDRVDVEDRHAGDALVPPDLDVVLVGGVARELAQVNLAVVDYHDQHCPTQGITQVSVDIFADFMRKML